MNPVAFMFMIIAAAFITPFMFTAIASQGQQEQATVAAMQMARIDKAAQGYITANTAAIEGSSTATTPAIITVPMLVNTGYLPDGFNAGNPYGQTWEVQVIQPATNQLQALVVSTGGQNVDAKQAGMVSQAAGSAGGVIGGGTGKLAIPHCGAGEACGVYQGWDVSTSGYQNVSPGHLAALIEYSNGQLQSDYLYRTAVPDQPQLNTMETSLNMGANNINNAQNVNVNQDVTLGNPGPGTGGSAASLPGQLGVNEPAGEGFPSGWGGGIHTWDEYANGTISTGENGYQATNMNGFNNVGSMTINDQSNGNYINLQSGNTGNNPEIETNGIIDGNTFGGNGYAMYNGSWWANNSGDSSQSGNLYAGGNVQAGYNVGANHDVYVGNTIHFTNQPYVQPGWGCNGAGTLIGSSYNGGTLLVCQNGQWQPTGSNNAPLQMYSADLSSGQTFPGQWQFCAVTDGFDAWVNIYPIAGPYSNGTYTWGTGSGQNGDSTVFTCYNLPGVYVPSNP